MRRAILLSLCAAAAVALALAGCQTTKAVSAEASSITAQSPGFAPGSQDGHTSMDFALVIGNPTQVTNWVINMVGPGGSVRTFSGDGKSIPATLAWDGKNDAGTVVPGGAYTASLAVTYGGKLPAGSAVSGSFVVDTTPPTGTLTASPSEFTPAEQGMTSPVTLTVDASSTLAGIKGWTIKIFDSSDSLVQSFSGNWPDHSITWDGKTSSGQYIQPSTAYSAVATIDDTFGLNATAKASVSVAAAPAQEQVPPATVPAGKDAIQASLNGFSPSSATGPRSIELYLAFASPSTVKSWKVTVEGPGQQVEKTWTGGADTLPSSVSWDGKDDSGTTAPDGTYSAALSVDYGSGAPSSVSSRPFLLDVTPPSGSVTLSEALFSPEETSKTIDLTVEASSPAARIDNWTMDIVSPEGTVFRSFKGTWPQKKVTWDGTSSTGAFVESAEDYPVQVKVADEFGNVGTLSGKVPIDILVFNTAQGYRIQASRIYFKPFTADYTDVPADIARQNSERLDALATKLKKFPDDRIRIVGHAVMIYWFNDTLGKAEEQDVLKPLSLERAKAIEKALQDRGVHPKEFIADGVGATDQIVPDSDLKDRWENRRVALFIEK